MAESWKYYHSQGDKIDIAIAKEVRLLLITTADVHIRDFADVKLSDFVDLVNYDQVDSHGVSRNWVKLHCRVNDKGKIDLAICYHLIKHRDYAWSVSVGITGDTNVLPDPSPSDATVVEKYKKFAIYLGEIIRDDLENLGTRKCVMFDDFDDTPGNEGHEPDIKQRKTRIGELAWIARSDDVRNHFNGNWETNPEKQPTGIKGYGHPDSELMMVSLLEFGPRRTKKR